VNAPSRLAKLRAIERALMRSDKEDCDVEAALEDTRKELTLERAKPDGAPNGLVTPREIFAATLEAARKKPQAASDHALRALHELLVSFLDATNTGCPESMKAMSIDQVRLLNQLHLAVGL
jgi:hypothetical protein